MKAQPSTMSGETLLVSALLLLSGAMLFEWFVVSPGSPNSALLRLIGAALAAFVAILPFRKAWDRAHQSLRAAHFQRSGATQRYSNASSQAWSPGVQASRLLCGGFGRASRTDAA